MKIKDIMQTNLITVDKDESLHKVIELMKKHDITKFPVLEKGKFVGIVSDEEILNKLGAIRQRRILPSSLRVSSATVKQIKSMTSATDLRELVDLGKKENVGMIPIIDGDELKGVLTKSDLLKLVKSKKPLKEIMKKEVYAVSPKDRVVHARRLMIDKGIERLPVLEVGKVVGIISSMDIAIFLAYFKNHVPVKYQKARLKNLEVGDAMKRDLILAEENMTASKAAEIMESKNVGCLPIVDQNNQIKGIISRTDLIRLI
jgi:CBS domain-containing protein